ncbi:MAG: hypothetical protein QOI06_2492 [Nocardioidaceae bacterium]|nr:hypothetical protein [Nocardioidaceae bacterium]
MSPDRRGRPYRVPQDRTSILESTVDVDSRVGWLLMMSRLHHEKPELALGGAFVAALSEAGLPADRSAVSRWESGQTQARLPVLATYEKVLELQPGQLTSVVNALRHVYAPRAEPVWTPKPDPMSESYHIRLDKLLDRLRSDSATGLDWSEFGFYSRVPSLLYLHADVWRELSIRLVDQLSGSVGLAEAQRHDATRILLKHKIAYPWLLRAATDFLDDPAVQLVSTPMRVLQMADGAEAAALLLARFVDPRSDAMFEAASHGIAHKVRQGQYSRGELQLIEARLLQMMRHRERQASGLEGAILAMPATAQARLIDASRGLRGHQELVNGAAHKEWVPPDTALELSRRIATAARRRLSSARLYDEDAMTPRIIREALFSARGEHRHYARLVLLGSPFRQHVAAELTQEIDAASLEGPLVPWMLRLLRYLAGPEQESAVLSWFPSASDELAVDMALTLGNTSSSDTSLDALVDRLTGDLTRLDQAILYSLGMRRAKILTRIARPPNSAPIRAAATWWLNRGGAVIA